MEGLSKRMFEEQYTNWISSAARDVAFSLNRFNYTHRDRIIRCGEKYLEEPESVFGPLDTVRIKEITSEKILFLGTDAVVFSQSIFAPFPGVFDYAVAMNRRYYIENSWYSIITLNNSYIEKVNDAILKYAIFHELLQKEIYEENMRNGVRKFTPEEKRKISNDTLNTAIERSGITQDELLLEKEIMLNISSNSPLIPKPFAETALFHYIEKNLSELGDFREKSINEKEDSIGIKLNTDFKEWLDFSTNTYRKFLTEMKKELNYQDCGYA